MPRVTAVVQRFRFESCAREELCSLSSVREGRTGSEIPDGRMIRVLGQYLPLKTLILIVTEGALIVVSIALATWIHYGNLADASWYLGQPYVMAQTAVTLVIFWISFYYNDLYDLQVVSRRSELVVHLLQALGM